MIKVMIMMMMMMNVKRREKNRRNVNLKVLTLTNHYYGLTDQKKIHVPQPPADKQCPFTQNFCIKFGDAAISENIWVTCHKFA